jgi:2-polyprenyl-3-methyl-5-hydroxy-6-metoxy-1,4-benzoquinol methylase
MKERVEKKDFVGGVNYQYSSDWIYSLETEEHWRLYWRQQSIMQKKVLPGHRVLEIGVGTGFTANHLRSKGVEVITLDIDAEKKPDIVANLVNYEFRDEFDHILAFEVFEHIPFSEFESAIQKLSRVCHQYFFISVPRNERSIFQATLNLPFLQQQYIQLSVPRGRITDKHHFWELDHKSAPASIFERAFKSAGFSYINSEKAFSRVFYTFKNFIG